MRKDFCAGCGSVVFFENVRCLKCGRQLGFLPTSGTVAALEPGPDNLFRVCSVAGGGPTYRACGNGARYQVCNWMIPADDPAPLCVACRLNQTIPDLGVPGNLARWHSLEVAKRRVIYGLLRLDLPLAAAPGSDAPSLRFAFLADSPGTSPVATSHSKGLITINISEADDVERERVRVLMREQYRTLVGHLRHEIGHFYWDRLVARTRWLHQVRASFGDESADYAQALSSYYRREPPVNWAERGASPYASSHPSEAWAEAWAHYLHIMDTVETAAEFGILPHRVSTTPGTRLIDAFSFDQILELWRPLACAVNTLNRGLGLPDLYPFVLSPAAIGQLSLVSKVIRGSR